MIGRIKGILIEKQMPTLLIDVGGIGYELQASMYSIYRLPKVGAEVTLYTHLVVREDAHILYGFVTKEERSLFRTLIKVAGIGPKSALAILSSIEPEEFVHCVMADDVSGLLRLPGVGRKTAQRLIIEMRDKLANWEMEGMTPDLGLGEIGEGATCLKPTIVKDAISALVALGYKPHEARRVILKQRKAADVSSEELIRLALKELSGK